MVGLPPNPAELKTLRKKANLTQKELANKAGMSQSLIARIEMGDVDPRVSTLRKILIAINDASNVKISLKNVMHQPVIYINLTESIGRAIELMRKQGISQLPVMKYDKVVGSIKEDTILNEFKDQNTKAFLDYPVSHLLEESFPIVSIETNIDEVSRLLSSGYAAVLVSEHGRMIGIITKIDLISNI